ncbi:MAG: dihydroorotase [Candidimonas sp.]|nr:MAG: dihydroorotase [Candidimonas sp.]
MCIKESSSNRSHSSTEESPAGGVGATPGVPVSVTITRPDDWHLHLRDGALLDGVIGGVARQFARAIVMPNLVPPVVSTALALDYRRRIHGAMRRADVDQTAFTPLMTLYLTDDTTADEIARARDSGLVYGVKLYPAGATTNSAAGVTNLMAHCVGALGAMQRLGMPLLVHGEVTDADIDVFDREAVFIERVMVPLRHRFPALKIVLEHVTTREGVDYVRDAPGPIAATITAHHLLYNRNALFRGGLRPHWYCLPILKRETHRQALLAAATGDSGRFFLGTDSAPHLKGAKERDCGCAGCYTSPHALALYATAFESAGRLDRLEAFACRNGPAFYGLPVNGGTLTLTRTACRVPPEMAVEGGSIVPLAAGESLPWSVAA